MKDGKRIVAAFDFDGTLTEKDTFIAFIRYSFGDMRFLFGMMLFAPLLALMKLHFYPNWKCKQAVFAYFFRGMSHKDFIRLGKDFAKEIERFSKKDTVSKLIQHQSEGASVYVISASIDEWVRPFCTSLGIKDVLATQAEVDADGKLTGKFSSPNCYGQEKVNRLIEVEPVRQSYYLYVYGDSDGDKELLSYADEGYLSILL